MNKCSARSIPGLFFALLLPLLVSCSAKVKNIETDPSFTNDEMMSTKICILGCTSIAVEKPADMMLSNWLSNELKFALLEKREGIDVMPFGEVRRAAGESLMKQCLQEIHDYGSIDPALLDDLAKELPPDVKYAVVHRIETDRMKFEEDENRQDRDGTSVVTGYTLKTIRMITATLYVYDLQQGKQVFLATIEGKDETKREITMNERVDLGGILGDVIDAAEAINEIFGDKSDERWENFPPPPTQDVVMRHIYNKFAEELPKKE